MKDMRVSQPDWLAADWGTSRLRIWGMRANGEVIGQQFGDCGMSRLARNEFEAEFIKLADPFMSNDKTLDVICCCLLYTSPSPRDMRRTRMPSSA